MFDPEYYLPKLCKIKEDNLLTIHDLANESKISYTTLSLQVLKGKPIRIGTKRKLREFFKKYEDMDGQESR